MGDNNHPRGSGLNGDQIDGAMPESKHQRQFQQNLKTSPGSSLPLNSDKPSSTFIAEESDDESETFHDANDVNHTLEPIPEKKEASKSQNSVSDDSHLDAVHKLSLEKGIPAMETSLSHGQSDHGSSNTNSLKAARNDEQLSREEISSDTQQNEALASEDHDSQPVNSVSTPNKRRSENYAAQDGNVSTMSPIVKRDKRKSTATVSEWSHQRLAPQTGDSDEDEEEEQEEEWQAMPALGDFDIYDDRGRIVAKASNLGEDANAYASIGGAGKGYTRVQVDEDAQSATSMDEETNYLFQGGAQRKPEEDEKSDGETRDALTQLEATKDLLTEGQRIAYVGVVRLTIYKMLKALSDMERTRNTKKDVFKAFESMEMWGQKMMVRLYGHMDIDHAEQLMIEQLAGHGVQPIDLITPLLENARIKNPMAYEESAEVEKLHNSSNRTSTISQNSSKSTRNSGQENQDEQDVPKVQELEDVSRSSQIDLDLRWTVLCDLFLLLISDGVYDSRSRRLLERVASALKIGWIQICRFEKRVIDALEMQEDETKESWNESDNMEKRRKLGLKRKYMVMGMATVGGGLVIGLSAGLLAPLIGAGLAAGFTTIGVTGTAGFLGGVGGAALITSAATAAGGTIAVRASNRRTGHVQTFEYRPLQNSQRLNLILTVSGWMNGKVDDVRLPYSTVDPVMGDIYSLLWEPEMLQSMGDTINILATEALTQTVQQVLGSTILVALMASIQLPVVLSKLAYLIDNPWSVSLDRANLAGLILADSLIDRHLGQRPITLLGFSLGSRLIFSCLKELSNRQAYGIIQNVYLFGSPVVAKKDEYLRARSVISGRFVNGYASNDWILGYLFRATSGGIMRVAGLAPIEDVPGLENIDVSHLVNGHMAYRAAMPRLLREVGWEVTSDEFDEIEDPDPENHEKRQRELIQEIDQARQKAEEKPEKRRFGLFKRGKVAEKHGWEMYDAQKKGAKQNNSTDGQTTGGLEANVLFDIDAIRKELESEMIEVRELNSTLPPMQITSIKNGEKHVEYLRLSSEIKPDEVAKMKLPPRPDDIDVEIIPRHVSPPPAVPEKRFSLLPRKKAAPSPSPIASPNPETKQSPYLAQEDEYVFEGPKELVSTMPPLNLTPSLSSKGFEASTPERPELRSHATSPTPSVLLNASIRSPNPGLASSSLDALNIEHNAWADNQKLDKEHEIKMTFE